MKFFTNIILEDILQPYITGAKSDEISDLQERVMQDMGKELSIPQDVLNSFKIKPELNPKIWMGEKLLPEVRKTLLQIARDFVKELELPRGVKMRDVLFLGSLANYNWSSYSDIDLHVVIDFSDFEDKQSFIKKHMDAEKNLWNDNHEILIADFPIELYIQDLREKVDAAAVYSVLKDSWILMPEKKELKLDKTLIRQHVEKFFKKLRDIKSLFEKKNYQQVINRTAKLKDEIKKMRKSGLEEGGELSIENLTFKTLRRTEFIEILDSYKIRAYDMMLSL